MNLILDNREHGIIELCRKYMANNDKSCSDKSLKKPIQIDVQPLNLADAIIKTTSDQKEIVYIERKSIMDLLASIKDGRYEEQSYRLANASGMPTHHIVYIIEGFLSSITPAEKKTVLSAITSLNIFKGFSVLRTANIHETAELLISMTDKIGRDLEKGRVPIYLQASPSNILNSECPVVGGDTEYENVEVSYSTVVKKVKKENLTPENIAEIILCQIPGISSKTAVAIMKKSTGSLMNLMQNLEKDTGYLNDIVLDNGRKINKNCSAKIIEYLL